jgi:hypothetical protein
MSSQAKIDPPQKSEGRVNHWNGVLEFNRFDLSSPFTRQR